MTIVPDRRDFCPGRPTSLRVRSLLRPVLCIIGYGLLASGCGEDPGGSSPAGSPAPGGRPAPIRRAVTDHGSWEVRYTPSPDPIPLNEHFAIEVVVTPTATGGASRDLSVVVDADMPAHKHGINTQPVITDLGDGRFRADGLLFHMPGDWVLTVDVGTGVLKERAAFPLVLEP